MMERLISKQNSTSDSTTTLTDDTKEFKHRQNDAIDFFKISVHEMNKRNLEN